MSFTIRRGKLPTDQFTIIPNAYIRDTRLWWRTRALLSWLMSHNDDFEITEAAMIEAGDAKRDGIRAMVGQLEEVGYLRRDRVVRPGSGSTVDYVLLDPSGGSSGALDDGSSVPRADQAKQDVSAGRTDDGSAVPLPIENQKNNKKTSSSKAQRGTRIPDDFMPDDKMRAWYAAERLQDVIDGRMEHERFMDYWRAVPGARGVKLDWPATWRNWMRSAADRAPRRPVSAPPSTPGTSVMPSTGRPPAYNTASTTNNKIVSTLAIAEKFRQQEDAQ